MRESIPMQALARSLSEMSTPVVSIAEGERAAWYRSMERLARSPTPADALYPLPKLAAAWLRVARLTWPSWPPQEPSDPRDPEPSGGEASSLRASAGT